MSDRLLITFNAGSSTVKIGLFAVEGRHPKRLGKGIIDFRTTPLRFRLLEGERQVDMELKAQPGEELDEVLGEAFTHLARIYRLDDLAGIGHRVVHGGDVFSGPVLIDDRSLRQMEALVALAPLHQPQALRLIRAIARLRPDLRQTASFDTSFHRTNDDLVRRFALPRALHERGIKRYGFHGLSYAYIASELARNWPQLAGGKIVAAHLGSGASLCAMQGGQSVDTSMGFSTLDGVPMATRCGALDAGVLLHLLSQERMPVADLEDMLYHRSGLLGVSGISPDSRDLLASEAPEAKEALELFTLRIAGEAARLAATMGGLDAMVFTAGVGEHQPAIRADICSRLMWLGIDLDPAANATNHAIITSAASRIPVIIIPTDEEQVIASEALPGLMP
ncbi:acetate/propionate family kinase [Mesorhizobium sp. VNQ89]|jgi:acetate kinase|uniref:acetate/propionate family kinase n=1 Tax=Hyphomicrobiales TaxID=356 RepID=UPI001F55FCF4|nr:acetate/propionate family kinase [Shinella zoogloeoides]HEV7284628.1 acetate/propionate family kinase [Kaistia sp.]